MKKLTQSEFIQKCRDVHGDAYDYSETDYVDFRSKVTVKCGYGHTFSVRPRDHYGKKSGCPHCYGNSKLTTESFIQQATAIHGCKYLYGKSQVAGTMTKVIITCPTHGDFEATPNNHLSKKSGCMKCAGIIPFDEFVRRANKKHNSCYTYSRESYTSITRKVSIICPIHGEFNQRGVSHAIDGNGCPSCGRITQASYRSKQFLTKNPHLASFPTIVYLIEFNNDAHHFIKIGITIKTINQRYANPSYKNFKRIVHYERRTTLQEAIDIERTIINNNIRYSEWNQLQFGGRTETFDLTKLHDILAQLHSMNSPTSSQ